MKIKRIILEISVWFKQVFRLKNGWILLPGFSAVLLVYAVKYFQLSPQLTSRAFHEGFAPWLVFIIFLVLLARTLLARDFLLTFLTVLSFVFFIRELNSTVFIFFGEAYLFKSKKLVDLLLVGMGIWAYSRQDQLFSCLNRSILLKVLLGGVLWTYLFSQLIARRFFRDILPDERLLHIPLEETAESAAHIFFLGFALFCLFFYGSRKTTRARIPSVEMETIPEN